MALRTSGKLFDPEPGVADRFWGKVAVQKDAQACWLWEGQIDAPLPYGKAYIFLEGKKRRLPAHRMAWALVHGYWPFDHIDHLCNNHQCVNPNHLDDVTRRENIRRLVARGRNYNAQKALCPRGHPYDKARARSNGQGSGVFRYCSICNWDVEKERRARKLQASEVDSHGN